MDSTQNQNESQASTLDIDPRVLAAYIIFGIGAILLIAAALRLGYWCIQYRSRKKELDKLIQNGSEDSGTNMYCGRGVISKTNDYTSDTDSLQIRMEDLFAQRKEKKKSYTKTGKKEAKANKEENQPIYSVVKKKKKEETHASILAMEAGTRSKTEDFWHINANEVPDNESMSTLTGSSMRLHRDKPLVKTLREDEEHSTSAGSEVTNSMASTYLDKEKYTDVNSERQSKLSVQDETRSVNSSEDEQLQNVMRGAHGTEKLSELSQNHKEGARKTQGGTEGANKASELSDAERGAAYRLSKDSQNATQGASRSSKLSNRESEIESLTSEVSKRESEKTNRASEIQQHEGRADNKSSPVSQRKIEGDSVISNSYTESVNKAPDVSHQETEGEGTDKRITRLSDSGANRTSEISNPDKDSNYRRSKSSNYAAAGIIGASSALLLKDRTSSYKDNDNKEYENVNGVTALSHDDTESIKRTSQLSEQGTKADNRMSQVSEHETNPESSDIEREGINKRASQLSESGVSKTSGVTDANNEDIDRRSQLSNYAAAGIVGTSNVDLAERGNKKDSVISNNDAESANRITDTRQDETQGFRRKSQLSEQEMKAEQRIYDSDEDNKRENYNKRTSQPSDQDVYSTSERSDADNESIHRRSEVSNYAAAGIVGGSSISKLGNKRESSKSTTDTERVKAKDLSQVETESLKRRSQLSVQEVNAADRMSDLSEHKTNGTNKDTEVSSYERENDRRRTSQLSDKNVYSTSERPEADNESIDRKSGVSNYAATSIVGVSNITEHKNKRESEKSNNDTESRNKAQGETESLKRRSRTSEQEINAVNRSDLSEHIAHGAKKNTEISHQERESDSKATPHSEPDKQKVHKRSGLSKFFSRAKNFIGGSSKTTKRENKLNDTESSNTATGVSQSPSEDIRRSQLSQQEIRGTNRASQLSEHETYSANKDTNVTSHERENYTKRTSDQDVYRTAKRSEVDDTSIHRKSGASKYAAAGIVVAPKRENETENYKSNTDTESEKSVNKARGVSQVENERLKRRSQLSEVNAVNRTSDLSEHTTYGAKKDTDVSSYERGNDRRTSQLSDQNVYSTSQRSEADKESIHRRSGASNYAAAAAGIVGISNVLGHTNKRDSDESNNDTGSENGLSQVESEGLKRRSRLSEEEINAVNTTSALAGSGIYSTKKNTEKAYTEDTDRKTPQQSDSVANRKLETPEDDNESIHRRSGLSNFAEAGAVQTSRSSQRESTTGSVISMNDTEAVNKAKGESQSPSEEIRRSTNRASELSVHKDVTGLERGSHSRRISDQDVYSTSERSEADNESIHRRSGVSNYATTGIVRTSEASQRENKAESVISMKDTDSVNEAETQREGNKRISQLSHEEIKASNRASGLSGHESYGANEDTGENNSRRNSQLSSSDAYRTSESSQPNKESMHRKSGLSNFASAGIIGASQALRHENKIGSVDTENDNENVEGATDVSQAEGFKRNSQLSQQKNGTSRLSEYKTEDSYHAGIQNSNRTSQLSHISTGETENLISDRNIEDSHRTSELSLLNDGRRTLTDDSNATNLTERGMDGVSEISEVTRHDSIYVGSSLNERVKELTTAREETVEGNKIDDLPEKPGPIHVPEGLSETSENKYVTTTDDIKAESINPGSFALLQASWKMREAQIQSGLDAPMLSPQAGLKYSDDDKPGSSETVQPAPVAREPQVFTQKYTNEEEEGRMFSFANSRGALVNMWGDKSTAKTPKGKMEDTSPKETRNAEEGQSTLIKVSEDEQQLTSDSISGAKSDEVGKFASEAKVAAVDQIYMDPQEILRKPAENHESPTSPTFSFPPPPPDDTESVENQSVQGSDIIIQPMATLSEKTNVVKDTDRPSSGSDTSSKNKRLRFNEDIEEIHRISVAEDDVSLVSSTVVASHSYYDGDEDDDDDDDEDDDGDMDNDAEDSNSMIIKDDVESDTETGNEFRSLNERPPTPITGRKLNVTENISNTNL